MEKKKYSLMATAFFAVGLISSSYAATWYLAKDASSSGLTPLSDMGYWGGIDGQAPSADDDLVAARDGARIRFKGITFTGNSLRIGHEGKYMEACHDSSTMTFPANSGGLILDKGGWFFNRNGDIKLDGPVSVLASHDCPFALYIGNESSAGHTVTITGPVSGDAEASLVLGPFSVLKKWPCAPKTTFRVEDVDGYAGTLAVTSAYDNIGSDFGTCLNLTSSTGGCQIAVWRGGVLSTVATDTKARVGSIAFHKGSRLQLNGKASDSSIGTIHASGLVTVENGPVEVMLPAGFHGDVPHRYPVLAGSADSVFTENDFTLVNASAGSDQYSKIVHLEVAVDATTRLRTLYVATYDVTQESFYPEEDHPHEDREGQGSSLTNALAWSDSEVPHANACYKTSKYLRTFREPDSEYAFPGTGLWLSGGHLRVTTAVFSVPRFFSSASSTISTTGDNESGTTVRSDRFCLVGGTLGMMAWKGQSLRLEGEIEGSALIDMRGINTSTGNPDATYELCGLNTNFSGNITVRQDLNKEHMNYVLKHPTLIVNDGRNLGGRMAEFTPRALTLTDIAFLSVTNRAAPVKLEEDLNRGVYVLDRACFNVADGAVLDVRQQILMSGKLWKDGEGTLVLGGTMRHELADGGEVCDIPRDGSNIVEVLCGAVRVESADALAGAQSVWAEGARLVVDSVDTDDVDLRRYGIRNVSADMPFLLKDGVSALPISAAEPEDAAVPKVSTNALFTVKSSAFASVKSILPSLQNLRIWPTLPVKYVIVEDSENGWITVALESRIRGTVISVR